MRLLRVVFEGSAEELRLHGRRDLVVNILLGGLYTTVARRHRAEYLASRTLIDGTPLAQLPPAKSRWPAILLVLAFIALRVASEFGHGPPLPLVVACGLLLIPYLWGSVTAWTLDAMRWRDGPLSFEARWTEIYAASWPLFVLGLAWIWVEPTVTAVAAAGSVDLRFAASALAAAVLAFPLLAAVAFNYRRLRFTRTRAGGHTVTWSARYSRYLRLWALTALAVLATAIAPVLLVRFSLLGSLSLQGHPDRVALGAYAVSVLLIVLLATPGRAWYEAQVFVLTWNGLRVGDGIGITCALDVRAFVRMRSVDTWRTLRTLGAYRAQAVVNAYAAKLAGLQVHAA